MPFSFLCKRCLLVGWVVLLGVGQLACRITLPQPATPQPAYRITYCSANPQELCILSFGRDAEGHAIIHVFVPETNYPEFHMRIQRDTGEFVYECVRISDFPTSTFCWGPALNLNEQIDLELVAVEDQFILAAGTFAIRAILISPEGIPSPFQNLRESPLLDEPGRDDDYATANAPQGEATPLAPAAPVITKTPTISTPSPSYP